MFYGQLESLDNFLTQLETVGKSSASLLAIIGLVGVLYAKVVLPVMRSAWRTIRRLNEVADDLLGDPAKGIPSMKQRMIDLERTQAEHMKWHGAPPRKPPPTGQR